MAKRILVPVERTDAMEFTLRVVRMLAAQSGGMVRLLAVLPIPEPLRDVRDSIIVTTDQQIERLAVSTAEALRRLATTHLDGVPVETSVIFGDRAVEIGREAGCFAADLVVMPHTPRRSPVGWVTGLTRRLLSSRADAEIDVLHVSALRAQPIG
jgi:nucleotide-binding universal stress UspA family protein